MIQSKYNNPLPNFVNHGIKEIGEYTYVLLIDMVGQTLIKRFNDPTDIKFALKPDGTSIATFWADPIAHDYDYLYKL